MKIAVIKLLIILFLIVITCNKSEAQSPIGDSHGSYICGVCDPSTVTDGYTMSFIRNDVNQATNNQLWNQGDYVIIGNGNGQSGIFVFALPGHYVRVGGSSGGGLAGGSSGGGSSGGGNGGGGSPWGGPWGPGGGNVGGNSGGGGGSCPGGIMVNNCVGDSCTATCQPF